MGAMGRHQLMLSINDNITRQATTMSTRKYIATPRIINDYKHVYIYIIHSLVQSSFCWFSPVHSSFVFVVDNWKFPTLGPLEPQKYATQFHNFTISLAEPTGVYHIIWSSTHHTYGSISCVSSINTFPYNTMYIDKYILQHGFNVHKGS